VHLEITKQVPLGCNILPPKVVILKPGDPPNCNDNVYAACEMYRNDLPQSCDERLNIACDQAIFGRLIPYKETHNDVQLLLGQWHTSKDMCSTLITIFSGYGIFNLAATLRYVKKEEKTMSDILDGNNYLIKMTNLAVFAPLFPAAGKFKYASFVAHFLVQVHDDSQLQKLLQIVCSVNLTSEGHYFAFGEALETYGVKFVKQNITGNITDQETMMLKIKAAQSERDQLSILLAEYIDDAVMGQNSRAIKSRKDSLWSLVANLSAAFNHPNPATHYLFKDAPEISKDGIENILCFYETGKLCFQEIESMKKQKRNQVSNPIQESNVQQQNTLILEQTSSSVNPLK
ncbi:4298_t:CDS:2, partial [Gigaspora rosea]